ncbi:amidase [Achromobacter sp. F4_2707]|uniref:amidase n=1 Tax=Achromobacter sp. F4_2707 TaxID=3114286 RepID=UPI0039C5D248
MKSAVELVQSYRKGEQSPVAVIEEMLAAINASPLNAFITVCAEQAKQEAEAAEQRLSAGEAGGALLGVPVAVKDLVEVAGYRTTMGSEQYLENESSTDAEVVRLLRKEGAIVIGKANTHQFAYGSTGDRSDFGPVKNPADLSRMPGGSSSGSAAAVAAGLAYGAVGTDTSASIRLPAALCGVVGMKASLGLVSKRGVFPLSKTLDYTGPISADVRDNAVFLEVMSGKEPGTYTRKLDVGLQGLTIGVPQRFFTEYLSPSVANSLQEAIRAFEAAGCTVKSVEIDHIQQIYEAQQLILKTEAYAVHEAALLKGAPYIAEVKERLLGGKDTLAVDYLRSLDFQQTAIASFDTALEDVDVLLTATCGITARLLDERQTPLNGETHHTPWLLTRLTAPTNFSGHPSLSVPFLRDEEGLPIGLQLIGKMHDEATLYQVGAGLEACVSSM